MALKEAIKEIIWLKSLYKELSINTGNNTIYTDSNSAIQLAKNPEHHSKTKHIDIQYHFIRENVLNKDISLVFVPTKEQIADILIKAINTTNFRRLVQLLLQDIRKTLGISYSRITRGLS